MRIHSFIPAKLSLGNAGNPLDRIPVFEKLLDACKTTSPVIVAAAPRSYWSSTNKTPTQRGLLADYRSTLLFANKKWKGVPIVLYGHSLGGAVAVSLLASLNEEAGLTTKSPSSESKQSGGTLQQETHSNMSKSIRGLILENPFSSIPDMVRALYPQKWLPYRFLAPLAWDKWNALAAMKNLSLNTNAIAHPTLRRVAKDMLVLVSARDEVVPREMGRALYDARPLGGCAKFVVIEDALHENAWREKQWAHELASYLEKIKM